MLRGGLPSLIVGRRLFAGFLQFALKSQKLVAADQLLNIKAPFPLISCIHA